jgi:hypothetical protein
MLFTLVPDTKVFTYVPDTKPETKPETKPSEIGPKMIR